MNASSEIDLTQAQRRALLDVFIRFADRLESVGVYGSRVQGTARPGSDVDLVVYGEIGRRDLAALRLALEESDLSIFADVVGYNSIIHAPLKAQIDYWMRPLFSRKELERSMAVSA